MTLNSQQQFKQFLEKSKNILILIPENPSADAVGSAWALHYFLQKTNTVSTIAFSNHLSEKFNFLPRPENIISSISGARDFVLSFDTSRNKIMKVRNIEENGRMNIYVTPEKGSVDPRDFSFIPAKFKYDLIVAIDCLDLEKLGKLHSENPDLFFEIPVINIDHQSANDNFGQINLVDVTASSASEIMARIFENINPSLIDKNIADCLLTGLIGATDSFQKKNTTPRSLSIAASLMDRGADQQEIIRWLYKTQPLHILKLWGRAMAKLNWEKDSKLVWSAITVEDFVQSRSDAQDLPFIIEKLQENYSEGCIVMVVYNDTPKTAIALIKTVDMETAKKIYPPLDGNIKRGMLEIKIERNDLDEIGTAIAKKIASL
jgi:nanoRNase/pAp phosphatase (c-di-AMP/oligoRNAs hydrolase)